VPGSLDDHRLLVCIGAQKAGTSSLHAWLGSMAEVSTSRSGKEIDYLSKHFDLGHRWYLDHFSAEKRVWLDVSPNYLIVADLRARLESLPVPVRCVLVVRDPVDRALSQHRHARTTLPDATPPAFEQAVRANPTYVWNGLYGRALERLAPLVGDGRLRVVWFEDLVADPAKVVDLLCADVGLSGRPSADVLATQANVSGTVRSQLVHRLSRGAGRILRSVGGEQAVSRFRASPTIGRLLSANRGSVAPEPGDQAGRDRALDQLRATFLPDLQLAEAVSGLPFVARYGAEGESWGCP
jgi:hypothetical protein